jgi:REP element-mobilizing transposase RayT
MTQARSTLVCLDDTPYYHITTRCVRRAFLCGTDQYSGQCFEHRRDWIRDRLARLESIFAIDVAAYAVMSNHCHLVVRLQSVDLISWSDEEVVRRWKQLFSLPPLVEEWLLRTEPNSAIDQFVKSLIEKWKMRLCDLGWFMRCLNEHIARRANAEDQCKGRFWEGRYKSQALLDETALLTCMTYVDLNPIRAGIALTPESSNLTSIQQRINHHSVIKLIDFNPGQPGKAIPYLLTDYMELVDWTGRAVLLNKRGSVSEELPSILTRLGVESAAWVDMMKGGYRTDFQRVVGPLEKIQSVCGRLQQQWMCGIRASRLLYPTGKRLNSANQQEDVPKMRTRLHRHA